MWKTKVAKQLNWWCCYDDDDEEEEEENQYKTQEGIIHSQKAYKTGRGGI
jgi:hypothetical protein